MFRSALIVLVVALAVQAKNRRGPLPIKAQEYLKSHPLPEYNGKIVGGQDVGDLSERPFQIVFEYFGSLRCGGAIIGDNVVLTAAHCCEGVSASSVKVRAGTLQREEGGEVYAVKEVRQNNKYNSNTISHDSCILITEEPITVEGAAPAKLPTAPISYEKGDTFTVTGWGTTSFGGLADVMQTVDVPHVPDDECDDAYSSYGGIDASNMICAGATGIDSCQGDSGGPMTDANGYHNGIVSWGVGCGSPGYPGVYAQTDFFLDWIAENSF